MVGVQATSEYAFLTPSALGFRGYREVCRRLDLEPVSGGYGALLCSDQRGRRLTLLTTDLDYLRAVIDLARDVHRMRPGPARGVPVCAAKFPFRRPDLVAVLSGYDLAA